MRFETHNQEFLCCFFLFLFLRVGLNVFTAFRVDSIARALDCFDVSCAYTVTRV